MAVHRRRNLAGTKTGPPVPSPDRTDKMERTDSCKGDQRITGNPDRVDSLDTGVAISPECKVSRGALEATTAGSKETCRS